LTRIVLDPAELAGTGSSLHSAAGEYEAIGARVASCDCGCMPPDVAATVDAAAAAIRARLTGVAGQLVDEASELAWRAGISHTGASAAIGAAGGAAFGDGGGGGGGTFAVGGLDPALFGIGVSVGGGIVTIGGTDSSWFDVGGGGSGGVVTIGGTDPTWFGVGGGSGGGAVVTIGGTDPTWLGFGNGGSSGVVTLGGIDPSTFGVGPGGSGGGWVTIGGTVWNEELQRQADEAVARTMPDWHFFPRGVGVPLINPFPGLIRGPLLGDVMSDFGDSLGLWTTF
jgi:hypothetical protein